MRLRKEQTARLSQHVLHKILSEKQIIPKVSETELQEKIQQIIAKNLQDEQKIEQEVEKLLQAYRSQIVAGQLNERELFLKIKKELAKKQKFPL